MEERTRKKTPVEELLDDVESYIEDWFQAKLPFAFHGRVRWTPPTDVYETEAAYHITMSVPGLDTGDCKVEFEQGTLIVRGVRREPCEGTRRYLKMEIPVGPFERRIRMGRAVEIDEIRVDYEDGLLRIELPKAEPVRRDVPID